MDEKRRIPGHVAIIMDGNGRWAEKRGLPRLAGHRAGVDNIARVLSFFGESGVSYVTLYGFSTENWSRPEEEVAGLFELLEERIEGETQRLNDRGVRIRHLGRLDRVSTGLARAIDSSVKLTRDNTGLTLSVALDYGGRDDILGAVRHLISEGARPDDIDEETFGRHLHTAGLPDVDLVIRTGGELRISNFLLWQAAYSEYYFTRVLWPDFGRRELRRALAAYGRRQRRFGGLGSA